MWMCGSTNPGTAVRPCRSIIRTDGPALGGLPPTLTKRPFRIDTVLATVSRACKVWILPLTSANVMSSARGAAFCADKLIEAGPPAPMAAAPALVVRKLRRDGRRPCSFIVRNPPRSAARSSEGLYRTSGADAEHHAEACLAAQHVIVCLRGAIQREDFVHGPHS